MNRLRSWIRRNFRKNKSGIWFGKEAKKRKHMSAVDKAFSSNRGWHDSESPEGRRILRGEK